ncbi:MAG: flagellar basal body L-ring protein FlgH [Phycisphaerales bacterium]|nr:flagellar basal body L-ring protein FlgH [Phycisphaerales bacterium]
MRYVRVMAGAAAVLMSSGATGAQALMDRPATEAQQEGVVVAPAPQGLSLEQVSLIRVEPPEPRTFQANDLITIIVSERSKAQRKQSIDTTKDSKFGGSVNAIPDLLKLLELRYQNYENLPIDYDLSGKNEFKGDGEYKRDDTLTTRVTGRVLEVKPNGTLLIESRTSIRTDKEEQLIVISGICRPEDVTVTNTVQSNQMFDLMVDIQNTGEIDKSSQKGLITKVFDTLFNF